MFGLFNKLLNFLSSDIGIDLGTANTLVFIKGSGVVVREPSVVAIQPQTKKVLAVGTEAKRMLGRTPGEIIALRPMKSGVIADFEITQAMLSYFIAKARGRKLVKPRVVIAVPSELTDVNRRAVEEAAKRAGAREVTLVAEPKAAAIGVGLPIDEPTGNMIVDIGGGTCEVALLSLSGIVQAKSVRVGGDAMDECIVQYMRRVYNLLIGERMSEDIKISIGSAYPLSEEMSMEVRGRDLVSGLPKTLRVTSEEIREALKDPVTAIVDAVRNLLSEAKPELASDLVDRGIVLSGGSSKLRGLDRLLSAQTDLPVIVADDPLSAVAAGTGRILEELDNYKKTLILDR